MTSRPFLALAGRLRFRSFVLAALAIVAVASHAQTAAPPYAFRHVAGTLGGPGKADGLGTAARFNHATGVAADLTGNVYVTDSHNGTIRKIAPNGTVTTLAGSPGLAGSADGTGTAARFDYPTGPAVDAAGNLFVTDWANNNVRKVTPAGVVTTVAGSPDGSSAPNGKDDGVGTAARFWGPSGVAVDASGNLFVADSGNQAIRKIAPDGRVTTLTLSGPPGWPTGGIWQGSLFGGDPYAVSWSSQHTNTYASQLGVDRTGNLYCGNYQWAPGSFGSPSYYLVLKVSPSGEVSTLSAFPTLESLAGPTVDSAGNLFVGATAGLLRMDPAGNVTNVTGATTSITGPGLTVTPAGDCIVADYEQILKITPTGTTSVLAGLAAASGSADGAGPAAGFKSPTGVTVDASGNVYVADTGNRTIRKITPAGAVTTLAGTAGVAGAADGTGPAAQFYVPGSIAADTAGNLYVSDNQSRAIRQVTPDGAVTTLSGIVISPAGHGLAVDAANNLYFYNENYDGASFTWSSTISKRTPAGEISTVATVGSGIEGLVTDRTGNLYVSLGVQRTVLKIDAAGSVSVFAGSGQRGTADGPAASAQFVAPGGLAVDRDGTVFVTDGNAIRRITPDGMVTTLGGLSTNRGSEDGLGSEAQFNAPAALAIDANGTLYVADTGNHAVRAGQPAGAPVIATQPQSLTVTAGGSAQFSVKATGIPAPTYQWYLNGSVFGGATAATLSFPNARSTDAGDYTVIVTNALGSVTSSKATLTVSGGAGTPPAPPSSASGGGGAIDPWFLAALLFLTAIKRWERSRRRFTEPS